MRDRRNALIAAAVIAAAGGLAGDLAAQGTPRLTLHPIEALSFEAAPFEDDAPQDAVPIPRAVPIPPPYPPPYPPPVIVGPPPRPRPPLPDRFELRFDWGFGEMEHETRGSNLDGDTDAVLARLQVEGYAPTGFGGGLRLEGSASDDDLFADTVGDDIGASTSEVFLYLAFRVDDPRLRFPIRAGVTFHQLVIEDDLLDIDVEYTSWALRFEGEPEIALIERDDFRWTVAALFGMAFGPTEIETDPSTVDDDAGVFLGAFEIGTRVQAGPVLLGVAWAYRRVDIEEGDDFYFALENEFSGVLLTAGVRF